MTTGDGKITGSSNKAAAPTQQVQDASQKDTSQQVQNGVPTKKNKVKTKPKQVPTNSITFSNSAPIPQNHGDSGYGTKPSVSQNNLQISLDSSISSQIPEEDAKPQDAKPRDMKESYWRLCEYAFLDAMEEGLVRKIALTIVTGGLYALIGGSYLLVRAAVKRGIQDGRQRLRDDYLKTLSKEQQTSLSQIDTGDWNAVLDFRVNRQGVFARRGFDDKQRQRLTEIVVDFLRRGGSVDSAKGFVKNINEKVRQPDFIQDEFVEELTCSDFYFASRLGPTARVQFDLEKHEALTKEIKELSDYFTDSEPNITLSDDAKKTLETLKGYASAVGFFFENIANALAAREGRLEFGLDLSEDEDSNAVHNLNGNEIVEWLQEARQCCKDLMPNIASHSKETVTAYANMVDKLDDQIKEQRTKAFQDAF